jgi:hypothetical protein
MATEPTKKTNSSPSKRRSMSTDHKVALAKGREEGRQVRSYLEALESAKTKRGRKRTAESIQKRLVAIDGTFPGANALERLQLTQEQMDLEAELAHTEDALDISDLEKRFVKIAKPYGQRKGISYSAWRAVGVSAPALQRAGIPRTRG